MTKEKEKRNERNCRNRLMLNRTEKHKENRRTKPKGLKALEIELVTCTKNNVLQYLRLLL